MQRSAYAVVALFALAALAVIIGPDHAFAATTAANAVLHTTPHAHPLIAVAMAGLGAAAARPIERKDDGPDLKTAVDGVMTAFEEFKTTNDARLKEIEKKGAADPLVTEKLGRIEQTLAGYEGVNQKLTLVEQQQKALTELTEKMDRLETAMKRAPTGDTPEQKAGRVNLWARAVVDAHVLGVPNLSEDQRKCIEAVNAEYKSLSVSTDTAGGYLAPVEFVREIIKGETEITPFRSLVRVRQTAMKSVQIPKRTGQFAAQRVSEQGTRSETTGLAYGLEELPVTEIYALVDISNQMLEDSAFDMQSEISMEAVEQFSVKEGAEFVSGSGVGAPEGFLTNANVGTTNSGAATAVTGDGLITLKHAIKTAYSRNGTFLLNRTTLGSVRKLKDGQGQYIWQPGLAAGKPNTIDGDPYVETPDMPNEGAGLKPVAYGDWRRGYTWADRISMEMLRDPYTQATAGNVRFIVRKRSGGQVVLAEAIRTLTCSA
jgi:HK97 family phage major capsid protein